MRSRVHSATKSLDFSSPEISPVSSVKELSPSSRSQKSNLKTEKSCFFKNQVLVKSKSICDDIKSPKSKPNISFQNSLCSSPQNAKLNKILFSIEEVLTKDSKQEEKLVKNIDKKINAINKKFDDIQTVDKIMFTKSEKKSVINTFNDNINNMYTFKQSGIKYFKDKILKQDIQCS